MKNPFILSPLEPELRFLQGGGEMGTRIREFNWNDTTLGNPINWSISLKTAVGIMLNSGAPTYIAWGKEFLQLYNDAFVPILGPGRDATALGSTAQQTWSDIWDFVGPQFRNVLKHGDIVSTPNKGMVLQRHGYTEECYFSFSCSPLPNESGAINGVFVTMWETTETVVSHRRNRVLKQLAETLAQASNLSDIQQTFVTLIESQPKDLPFGLWYESGPDHHALALKAAAGLKQNAPIASPSLNPVQHPFYAGKIDPGLTTGQCYSVDGMHVYLARPLRHEAVLSHVYTLPLFYASQKQPNGWLVFGMNPLRPCDDEQMAFFDQIQAQLALAIARVHQIESERREHQFQLEAVMHAGSHLVWMSDADKKCTFFNQNWLTFRGSTLESEVAGAWIKDLHPDDLPAVYDVYYQAFDERRVISAEYRLRRSDGVYRWIFDISTPRYSASGEFLGYIGTCLDITEQKEVASALTQSEARYRQIVETSQEGIWIFDADALTTFANARLEQMLGASAGGMLGRSIFDFMDADSHNKAGALLERQRQGFAEQYEFQLRKADGSHVWVLLSASPFKDEQQQYVGALAMVVDITERKENETAIQHLATHDDLTGLPNRNLLRDRMDQAMLRADRSGLGAGLIFLDCDNFKYINDSYGHSVGDAVLQQIGRQLRHIVRDANTVARLGGDEFVILLSDLQDAVTDTAAVAQQIIDTLKQPVPVGELELFVTASVGISLYPSDAATAEDLLKHADTALYRAKEMGRHRYQFYSSEMSDRAVARASLESALRRAIEQQQFALHYQPQIEIATGRVIGVEALIRWECPRQGLIPPARFIAVAEETGMILPIGEWVLESACRQARAWLDAGLEPMTVSVNLSALQLRQADFFTRVSNILDRTGLHPGQLDLEITESMLVSKTESLQALLHQLKDLGVMLSLDDFGTGYSNLGYLQSFPLTRIKIDRSFIKGIPGHLDNVAIATAIVNLGHGLGLQVLAEGVETAGEAQFLADIGCEYAQGYWYGKPMPATEFETWLAQTGSYSWVA